MSYNSEESMDGEEKLEKEREAILAEMASIRRLRRGTVNEQYFEVRKADGTMVKRGPYYLYSRTEKGRSYSQRIAAAQVEAVRTETENCKRFKELAERCVVVTEQLTVGDERASQKKGSKKPLRRKSKPKSRG